jgi:hypothetical protein
MEWLVPDREMEVTPPDGYVLSFVTFHKHGFVTPSH